MPNLDPAHRVLGGFSNGAHATLLVEDVGKHDFPVSAYPAVRQWLREVALGER